MDCCCLISYSKRLCRQIPHGEMGWSLLPVARLKWVIAIVSNGMPGYKEAAAASATRSAHNPAGEEAFSWFVPRTIFPFCNNIAAATKN